jgi:tellurite resistance protein
MSIIAPHGIQDAATNELLAMLEVMYLVATADGFFSQDERSEFLKSVRSLSEGKVSTGDLGRLVEEWAVERPELDRHARLQTLALALPDTTSRRIAYGLGLQIAEADGQLLESEARVLHQIASAFQLEEGEEEEIAHSVRMSRAP